MKASDAAAVGRSGPFAQGLEGIVFADTELSDVDGEQGRLIIAGRDVERMAGTISFAESTAALWRISRSDSALTSANVADALSRGRMAGWQALAQDSNLLAHADGMDALRASMAALDVLDPGVVSGAVATFASAWCRARSGQSLIAPDPKLDHARDYLRMLGLPHDDDRAAGLDAYLVTVSDHGMNASTFAARVVASTGSDLVSSIVAAIGALKGPLHGGAPGPVLDMLDAIGAEERAVDWLQSALSAGRRIMGMGHRIYRVRDPRAAVLERTLAMLAERGLTTPRLSLARAVERAAEGVLRRRHPDRPLHANVEFYTAVLLDALGLDRRCFSPTFAVGRVVGWCAHVEEQRRAGKLVRPASRYVGPRPELHSPPDGPTA